MKFFLMGGDGKEYGPVTSDVLIAWRAQGRLDNESLLRPEGSQVWVRWADQPLLNRPETKDQSDREREFQGALERLHEFPFGAGILISLRMFLEYAAVLTGGLLIFLILYTVLNLPCLLGQTISLFRFFKVPEVAKLPVYVDWILILGGFSLTGLFDVIPAVGFFRLNIHLLKGEKASPLDILWGFSHRTLQFVLLNVMLKVVYWAVLLSITLLVGVMFALIFAALSYAVVGNNDVVSMAVCLGIICGALIGLVVSTVVQVFLIFAPMLVMEKNRDAWSALVDSCRLVYPRWGWLFLYFLAAQMLSFVGVLLFGLGIVLTLPIYYTALAYAYLYLFDEKVEQPAEIGMDVLINAGVLPGLGTWMHGHRGTGALQMAGAFLGCIIALSGIVWYFIGVLQTFSGNMSQDAMYQRLMPALILACTGIGVFMLVWLWSVLGARVSKH